jgi:branched-chain amino acid transport system substrate-binding protein
MPQKSYSKNNGGSRALKVKVQKLSIAGIAAAILLGSLYGKGHVLADSKTITLGAAVQLTGSMANPGHYFRDAYQIAVDQINAKGGITVGGTNYKFALKALDSQSDVNLGMRQYVELITREKVDFLLGGYGSNDTLDDSSVAEKYEVPFINGGGASSQIYGRGYKYVFGTSPPADDYFRSTIEMMMKLNPKPNTVALVSADDAFDVSVANGTRKLLQSRGIEIIVDQQYSESASDFSSVLSLIKSKSPDVIFWSGHALQALNFIRQAKSLAVNAKGFISFTDGVPTADFRKALGRQSEYVFGVTPWIPSSALKDEWFGDAASFVKIFEQRYGYTPDYHVVAGVADVETYAKAITAAGSLDRRKVRDAIASVSFDCLYGHIRYNPNGQISLPQVVIQIQNDQVIPIYTDHFVNKPIYPAPRFAIASGDPLSLFAAN